MSGEAASYQGGASDYNNGSNEHSFVNNIQNVISNADNLRPAEDHEIQAAKDSYDQVFQNQNQNNSPQAVGNAAAVRALEETQRSGGGMNDMIKLAISYAVKLFTGSGENNAGDRSGQNQAMQQAAMMAMKLFMSKQASGNANQGSGVNVGSLLSMFMGASGNSNQQQQQQASSKLDVGSIIGSVSSILGSGGSNQQPQQQQQQFQQQQQPQQQQQQGGSGFSSIASGLMSKILN